MLPEESREAAGRRWMRAFDALYDAHPSMFSENAKLVIMNRDDLKVYDEDGREYTLQLTPGRKNYG